MNMLWKGYSVPLLLFVLTVGMMLGACGVDSPTGTTVQTKSGIVTAGSETVGLKACTECHTAQTAAWMKSRHANVEPLGNLDSKGSPNTGYFGAPAAGCTPCHDPQGDSGQLIASYTGNTARPVVGCESCHGGGLTHADAGGSGPVGIAFYQAGVIGGATSSLNVSAQFLTCSFQCHRLLDPDDPANAMLPLSSTTHTLNQGVANPGGYISDTHFASAGSYSADGRNLADTDLGYAMDCNSEKVCSDCHDPHGTAAINRDWVNGPHGDRRQSSTNRYAWSAFNWSCETSTVGCALDASASPGNRPRPFCQRCHTTSGFVAFADANAAGDRQRVRDLWNGTVSAVSYTPGWKPEMLKCNGCHTDNKGTIRNPGAYNAIYGYRTGTPASAQSGTAVIQAYAYFQYPDISSSNVCVPCHGGRNRGETIELLNTPQSGTTTTVSFASLRSSTPHDETAAGVMFKALGYEFEGRDYTNPPSYIHDKIGTSAVPGTGTGGPCVSCHLYRAGQPTDHLFRVVSQFATTPSGTITVVSSSVCYKCHAGSSQSLGEVVDQEFLAFQDALSAISTVQAFYRAAITSTNWLSTGDTDWTGNTTGKKNMGASFNRSFLSASRGAYAHNSKYTKKLIYDSIDWLDNNKLDYSTGTTLSTVCSVASPSTWCNRALPYVLPNGIASGASAERPY